MGLGYVKSQRYVRAGRRIEQRLRDHMAWMLHYEQNMPRADASRAAMEKVLEGVPPPTTKESV